MGIMKGKLDIMKGVLLWLLGVPIPVIILIYMMYN